MVINYYLFVLGDLFYPYVKDYYYIIAEFYLSWGQYIVLIPFYCLQVVSNYIKSVIC